MSTSNTHLVMRKTSQYSHRYPAILDEGIIQYREILHSASPRVIFTRYSTIFCHELNIGGNGGNIARLSASLGEYCIVLDIY